jgi:hypothetical protein
MSGFGTSPVAIFMTDMARSSRSLSLVRDVRSFTKSGHRIAKYWVNIKSNSAPAVYCGNCRFAALPARRWMIIGPDFDSAL